MATAKKKGKKKASKKKTSKKTGRKGTKKGKKRVARSGKASKAKVAYPAFKDKKNIGNYAKNMILQGKSTDTVIAQVQKKFPESQIKPGAVSWYRAALESEGYDVPAPS